MYFYQKVVFAYRKLPATPAILPPTSEIHKSFFLIQNPINLKKFWIPPLVPMWITPPLVSWLVWHLCLQSSVLYFSCLPSKQENQSRNRIWINSRGKILHVASNLVQKCDTQVCVSASSTNRLSTFWNPFGAGQEWASTTHIPLCE